MEQLIDYICRWLIFCGFVIGIGILTICMWKVSPFYLTIKKLGKGTIFDNKKSWMMASLFYSIPLTTIFLGMGILIGTEINKIILTYCLYIFYFLAFQVCLILAVKIGRHIKLEPFYIKQKENEPESKPKETNAT